MDIKLIPESKMLSSESVLLRKKLDQFYGTVSDYTAFASVSNQVECWKFVGNEIHKRYSENGGGKIRVLEIGAGKSGFGSWLKLQGLKENIYWTAQDVTYANRDWLTTQADQAFYGDIGEMATSNKFDIIFSTYVLEHVTNPEKHLDLLYNVLKEGGKFFIFCPRYDMPGYMCPSTRHLNSSTRLQFALKLLGSRIQSIITRRPAFLIQTDLAAFHQPFFLDADAVHWASQLDLRLWAKKKKSSFKTLNLGSPKIGTKDWIVKRLLTCAIEIQK